MAKKTKLPSFTHPCPRPPHSVVFDLDGTLIDSAPVIAASYNAGLKATGHRALRRTEILGMLGPPLDELYRRRVPAGDVDAACQAYRDEFAKLYAAHVGPCAGAHELLDRLREAGVRIGVITNRARHTMELLDLCDLRSRVDAVVAVNDGPYAAKPSADMLYVVMDQLDAIPAETCYVGDSIVDMQAGTTAQLWNIGLMALGLEAGTLEAAGAHVVAQDLTVLSGVLGLDAPKAAAAPTLAHGSRVALALSTRQVAAPTETTPQPAEPAAPAPEPVQAPSPPPAHGARVALALRAHR